MKSIAGIDVSKHELVIYMKDKYYSVENNEKSLKKWFIGHKDIISQIELFAYEPTGGYEKKLAQFLHHQGLPGCMCHANHVRAFAIAMGYAAKTDKIDAKVIALFAQAKELDASELVFEYEQLVGLISRREQLVELQKEERSRLETVHNKEVERDIKQHVAQISARIDKITKLITEYVQSHAKVKSKVDLLLSIPGVGLITAISLIAYMPEIFSVESNVLAALAGLAPMNKDSGLKQGKRKISGGRAQIRRVLYMASLSAIRYNNDMKIFYERLKNKGKPFKVAMTAVMRKMLILMKSILVRKSPWIKELATS